MTISTDVDDQFFSIKLLTVKIFCSLYLELVFAEPVYNDTNLTILYCCFTFNGLDCICNILKFNQITH